MINFAQGTKVFLACQPVDMRKGFNGLAAQVATVIKMDPLLRARCLCSEASAAIM